MNAQKTSATCVLIICLGLTSSSALAYETRQTDLGATIHWQEDHVSWHLNEAGSPLIPFGSYRAAVANAYQNWNRQTGADRWSYAGETTDATHGWLRNEENFNNVVWEDEIWDYGEDALAMTLVTFNRSSGVILDADILVNGVDHTSWAVDGRAGHQDIENVFTHEVGHAVGLGHSAHSEASMWSSSGRGETKKRTLHDDDLLGYYALYPMSAAPHDNGSPTADTEQPVPSSSVDDDSAEGGTSNPDAVPTTPHDPLAAEPRPEIARSAPSAGAPSTSVQPTIEIRCSSVSAPASTAGGYGAMLLLIGLVGLVWRRRAN